MTRWRTLLILSLIAAALVVVVVLRGGKRHVSSWPTRVVPEVSYEEIARLVLRRPGEAAIELGSSRSGEPLRLRGPLHAPVDAAAVDALSRMLEKLTYARRVAAIPAGAPKLVVTIGLRSGREVELRLGEISKATQQAWLVRTGESGAFLIEAQAARALDLRLDDLRRRRVFDTPVGAISGVEIDLAGSSLQLSGKPLSVHLPGVGRARADHARITAALAALVAARLERFETAGGRAAADAFTLRLTGATGTEQLVHLGACPGAPALWLVDTPAGRGCTDPAPLVALQKLAADPASLVDAQLTAQGQKIGSVRIVAGDDAVSATRRGGTWVGGGGSPVSTTAVDDWLARFSALGVPRPRTHAAKPGPERARVELGYEGGERDVIQLFAPAGNGKGAWLARRNDEPVYVPLAAGAAALFEALPQKWQARHPP